MSKKKQNNQTQADFTLPSEWALFGPAGKYDPEPEFAGMMNVPKELTIAGKKLAAQKAAFADNRLDLGALLGGKGDGKTAYLLAVIEADKATEVEFGAGACSGDARAPGTALKYLILPVRAVHWRGTRYACRGNGRQTILYCDGQRP